MDVREQLQTYAAQLVALGQATLEQYRRGETLPDDLAELAAGLVELESALAGRGDLGEAVNATGAPDEIDAAFAEPALADEWSSPDEVPAEEPDFAAMSPVEVDNWLRPLDEADSGMVILTKEEPTGQREALLVIDVEEEAGGGPATLDDAAGVLPALVIDPVRDLPDEETGGFGPPPNPLPEGGGTAPPPNPLPESGGTTPPPNPMPARRETAPFPPQPTTELRYCTNCGADLRPGRRFCYRCGASVAEMVGPPPNPRPEGRGTTPPPNPLLEGRGMVPPASSRPAGGGSLPRPGTPPEEWPTVVGDLSREKTGPFVPLPNPATRFCANCGLGVGDDVTVCPECGSRDIA